MAHNVKKQYMIAEHPWYVYATDDATHTFLAALNGSGTSDFAAVEESQALWAVQVKDTNPGVSGGTAYVVSHEALKRVMARRFS